MLNSLEDKEFKIITDKFPKSLMTISDEELLDVKFKQSDEEAEVSTDNKKASITVNKENKGKPVEQEQEENSVKHENKEPFKMQDELYNACPEEYRNKLSVENAGHGESLYTLKGKYIQAVEEFLKKYV